MEVSDLCRREGLNPVQFHAWKNQLLGAAPRIFEGKRGRPDAEMQRLAAENAPFKNVIAEITAENLDLKKGRSAERTTANSRPSCKSVSIRRSS